MCQGQSCTIKYGSLSNTYTMWEESYILPHFFPIGFSDCKQPKITMAGDFWGEKSEGEMDPGEKVKGSGRI